MKLKSILFPKKCVLCRENISENAEDCLCDRCRADLENQQERMNGRLLLNADVISVGEYKGLLRAALLRIKQGKPAAIPAMQNWICSVYRKKCGDFMPDIVTFVPSSSLRDMDRGFTLPKELAKAVAKLTDVPMKELFRHTLFSQRQAGMSGEQRKIHAAQSIELCGDTDLSGKRIIIVDDIVASGSTMNYCAGLLREAGASEVVGLTIAKS